MLLQNKLYSVSFVTGLLAWVHDKPMGFASTPVHLLAQILANQPAVCIAAAIAAMIVCHSVANAAM